MIRAALLLALTATPALAEITWDESLYDPAAARDTGPADLVLPMPCGGAMAFQRIDVPVNLADPLADRRIRLGQPRTNTGFSDYLRPDYLRGAFSDPERGLSYYFIARYEMTVGQYDALAKPCREPERRDIFAKGGISWFDAIDLSRRYSEWLLSEARDAMPEGAEGVPFIRLPTETEWEYATRGGEMVEPDVFEARRFFADGSLDTYARFHTAGSRRTEPGPIGTRTANPESLFDVYGNAEELMFEPFRLNAVGRAHGQIGGIVTRGGSVISTEDQIYSAQRTEYPHFATNGATPQVFPTFGVRLVISSSVTSTARFLGDIRARWLELAEETPGPDADALATINGLLEEEFEPRRRAILEDLKNELLAARINTASARQETAKSLLLSGVVFLDSILRDQAAIGRSQENLNLLLARMRVSSDADASRMRPVIDAGIERLNTLRIAQRTSVTSLRQALEFLANDLTAEETSQVFDLLRRELEADAQTRLLNQLDKLRTDLGRFKEDPNMDTDMLLALILRD